MKKPEIRKLSAISDGWVCELHETRGLGNTPAEAFRAWAAEFGDYENVVQHSVDPERDSWWCPPTIESAPAPRLDRTTFDRVCDKVVSIFTKRAA